jgi:hypothetical protein
MPERYILDLQRKEKIAATNELNTSKVALACSQLPK